MTLVKKSKLDIWPLVMSIDFYMLDLYDYVVVEHDCKAHTGTAYAVRARLRD